MNRHPFADGWKIALSLFAGPLALLFFAVAVVAAGSILIDRHFSSRVVEVAKEVHTADTTYLTKTVTVVKYQRRVDTLNAIVAKADSAVTITDSSHAIVHDTVATVPVEVIADLRVLRRSNATKDTLITTLYGRDSTQEWRIATRDKMLRELSRQAHPLCGRKCGYVLGLTSAALVYKAIK